MTHRSLLFDLGNTSLKIAVATDERILQIHALSTQDLTQETVVHAIRDLLPPSQLRVLTSCLVCSVVPTRLPLLHQAVQNTLHLPLHSVPEDIAVPLTVSYNPPASLGHDRLVEAYAARALHRENTLIVLDLGTAITLDCVQASRFLGGLILPGPSAALKALNASTSQLPLLPLADQITPFELGRTTQTCIQNGVYYGLLALLEGLIKTIRKHLQEDAPVIATGGLAEHLSRQTHLFDAVHTNLVLEGLRLLSST